MPEILYQTKNVVMYIDKTVPCLVNEWHGFINSKSFRQSILTLVSLLEKHKLQYPKLPLLADTQTLGVIKSDDLKWVTEDINPQYVAAGATHEAFIVSEDAFGQIALEKYMVQTTEQGDFTVQIFDNIETAKTWLKEI